RRLANPVACDSRAEGGVSAVGGAAEAHTVQSSVRGAGPRSGLQGARSVNLPMACGNGLRVWRNCHVRAIGFRIGQRNKMKGKSMADKPKTLYQSELVQLSGEDGVEVLIKSDVLPSKFKKGTF